MSVSTTSITVVVALLVALPIVHSRCLCPEKWVAYGQHCYRYVPRALSFDTAERICVAWGRAGRPSHLASVLDAAEALFLAEWIQRETGSYAWIGMTDIAAEGVWTWLDGSPFSIPWSLWAPGQPDDAGSEDCGMLLPATAEFSDFPCHNTLTSICKMPQRYRPT